MAEFSALLYMCEVTTKELPKLVGTLTYLSELPTSGAQYALELVDKAHCSKKSPRRQKAAVALLSLSLSLFRTFVLYSS